MAGRQQQVYTFSYEASDVLFNAQIWRGGTHLDITESDIEVDLDDSDVSFKIFVTFQEITNVYMYQYGLIFTCNYPDYTIYCKWD